MKGKALKLFVLLDQSESGMRTSVPVESEEVGFDRFCIRPLTTCLSSASPRREIQTSKRQIMFTDKALFKIGEVSQTSPTAKR